MVSEKLLSNSAELVDIQKVHSWHTQFTVSVGVKQLVDAMPAMLREFAVLQKGLQTLKERSRLLKRERDRLSGRGKMLTRYRA